MTETTKKPRVPRATVRVSELNLRKAGTRLLASALVSPEIFYIQRELGATATQAELDAKVISVRSMKWSEIVLGE